MIRVSRESVTPPKVLASTLAADARSEAVAFFSATTSESKQREFDFDGTVHIDRARSTILNNKDLRQALHTLFQGRCAYCTMAWPDSALLIDHFRPRQGAVSIVGQTSPEHYYWLAYEWENLYLCCRACNMAKGAKFPVSTSRAQVGQRGVALLEENPGLLDPCSDNPEDFLVYLPTGQVVTSEPRGIQTIDVLALNRPELIDERRRAATDAVLAMQRAVALMQRGDYEGCAREVSELYDIGRPMAGVRRQFCNSRVHLRLRKFEQCFSRTSQSAELESALGGLTRFTGSDLRRVAAKYLGQAELALPENNRLSSRVWDSAQRAKITGSDEDSAYRLRTAGIRSITIENFMGISDLNIDISENAGPGTWTMLLGENGSGKTSLLQAVAIALASDEDIHRSRLTPARVVRQGASNGSVIATLAGGEGSVGRYFQRGRPDFERIGPPDGVDVIAYGATRLLPSHSTRVPRALVPAIGNLFNPRISLPGTRTWIPLLSDDHFDAVARALRRFLMIEDPKTYFTRASNGAILRTSNGRTMRLAQMSAGYQAMAALALDMMRSLLTRWGSLEAAEGVVLIDEIGAHLHPRWQMRVVSAVRAAVPRVQVVATTHDPLCLRGMRDGEVRVLNSPRSGLVKVRGDLPPIEGLTVDQLLTSEHFGLHSTVDPEIEAQFEEYYALLDVADRKAAQEARLAELRSTFAARRLMGQTRRERMVLEAADEFIAAERTAVDEHSLVELREDARARLREIWGGGLE